MVVSPTALERLADPEYVKCLRVAHSGYRPRCRRMHDFAREWQRLEMLPDAERSSATDKIWQITVRTSLRRLVDPRRGRPGARQKNASLFGARSHSRVHFMALPEAALQ